MRNDLGRVCETGSVRAASLLDVEPHPGVWHLVSTVSGRLRDDVGDDEPAAGRVPARLGDGRAEAAGRRGDRRPGERTARRVHRRHRLRQPVLGSGVQRRDQDVRDPAGASNSASAAASPPTACRCWNGASACTRRHRCSARSARRARSTRPSSRRLRRSWPVGCSRRSWPSTAPAAAGRSPGPAGPLLPRAVRVRRADRISPTGCGRAIRAGPARRAGHGHRGRRVDGGDAGRAAAAAGLHRANGPRPRRAVAAQVGRPDVPGRDRGRRRGAAVRRRRRHGAGDQPRQRVPARRRRHPHDAAAAR